MRWGRKRGFDAETVHRIAGLPVEGRPHTPPYLDDRESFAELTRNRQVMTLRLQVVVDGVIERLETTWRQTKVRDRESLREQAVLFVAHSLGIALRDVAGQPESPAHTKATDLAVADVVRVGEARLCEMHPPFGKSALHEFFFPTKVTRQFERVGDEMVQAAVCAYINELRRNMTAAEFADTDRQSGAEGA